MKRYREKSVTGTANTETTTTLLTGTEDEPKDVDGVLATEITATLVGEATIVVYLNTLQIAELDYRHLLNSDGSNVRPEHPFIPLDVHLGPGDTLEVGHISGSTATDMTYAARYEVSQR